MEHQTLEAADFPLHQGGGQGIWAQCMHHHTKHHKATNSANEWCLMALNHTFKHQICGCTKMVFHHLFTIAAAWQSAPGNVYGNGECFYALYAMFCTELCYQLCQPAYMKVLKRRCFAPNCTKQCTYVWLHTLSFRWNVLAPRAPLRLLLPVKVKYTPFLLHILYDLIASI